MRSEYDLPRTYTRRAFIAGALATPLVLEADGPKISAKPEYKEIKETFDLLDSNWDVMPGVIRTVKGLEVSPTRFSLVEQDGTFAQENPPINFGTRLEKITGDFAIAASIDLQKSNEARLQLYGKTPIVADEFRIERGTVQLTVNQDKLKVKLWDGTNQEDPEQKPTTEKTFAISSRDTQDVIVIKRGNKLQFFVNGAPVGQVQEKDIFDDGNIFLGIDSTDQPWMLNQFQAVSIGDGNVDISDATETKMPPHDLMGLQSLAEKKRPDFTVSMARAVNPLFSDSEYQEIALDSGMFGGMTPENAMKMINLQPQRGVYTFEQADALVAAALKHDISIHGHTLVFAEANPPWFNELADPKAIKDVMIEHITTVVDHYKGKVRSWDVINEPVNEDGNGLREHTWKEAMGEDYSITALDAAHKADPDAMLFINEYGLEADGERWDTFVALMKKLKPQLEARGIPLDKIGVGFQAHVYESGDRIDPQTLRNHIRQLGELGFKTRISEHDVYSGDGDTVQAQEYASTFKVAVEEPNCIGWSGWILSDRYNYWNDGDKINQGVDGLYDKDMQPRPALKAMQKVLTN